MTTFTDMIVRKISIELDTERFQQEVEKAAERWFSQGGYDPTINPQLDFDYFIDSISHIRSCCSKYSDNIENFIDFSEYQKVVKIYSHYIRTVCNKYYMQAKINYLNKKGEIKNDI